MTTDNATPIPWSSIMDLWEREDPRAYCYFWDYFFDKDYSPYKQLIKIHKIKGDTNNEFHDSLMSAIFDAARSTANCEDKQVEIDDICREGVYVTLYEF